ncbi:MAG: hypothetical protein AB9907_13260 [Flexilinea sp.]
MKRKAMVNFTWLRKIRIPWQLWVIFAVSILSKIFIIPFLGAAWFPYSDEHLFIELAKNLYYHHNLNSNIFFYIKQYNEILYPLMLSPLYVFYSPEKIMTVFRIFGLFTMSSVVFPAYKLGLAVLNSRKQAFVISIFAILIPEMSLTFSVGQEVVYYPLFVYTIYLIYKKICGIRISPIYLGFILFLLWSCKAVGAAVFLGYVLYLLFELVFIDKFKNCKKDIIYILVIVLVVLSLRTFLSIIIQYANFGSFGTVGDNYTSSIIERIGEILDGYISDFPNGIMQYLFFTGMIFMIFPVILTIDNFSELDINNRKFLLFISVCFIITIVTIVSIIYTTEGGAAKEINRIHYRYLFQYMIPLFIMMMKVDFSTIRFKLFGILYSSFLLLYFIIFKPKFASASIIDAKSLLLIEEIQNRIINGFNILVLIIVFFSIYIGYTIYKHSDKVKSKRLLIWTMCLFLLINHTFAIYKTFRYYTTETDGITRKVEYSELSKLINSKPGLPIVLFNGSGNWIDSLFSTQSNKDFVKIESLDNPLIYVFDPVINPSFLITPKNHIEISRESNVHVVGSNLTIFDVYDLSDLSGEIILNYQLLHVYSDNWLMDDSKLLIAGNGRGNQVEVSLDLITNKNAGNIIATMTDSTGRISSTSVNPNGTSVTFLVNKNTGEQNFTLNMDSKGSFIPAEVGINNDTRKLTYQITKIIVK